MARELQIHNFLLLIEILTAEPIENGFFSKSCSELARLALGPTVVDLDSFEGFLLRALSHDSGCHTIVRLIVSLGIFPPFILGPLPSVMFGLFLGDNCDLDPIIQPFASKLKLGEFIVVQRVA